MAGGVERGGQLVLGLGVALGDVDEAPERRLLLKAALAESFRPLSASPVA